MDNEVIDEFGNALIEVWRVLHDTSVHSSSVLLLYPRRVISVSADAAGTQVTISYEPGPEADLLHFATVRIRVGSSVLEVDSYRHIWLGDWLTTSQPNSRNLRYLAGSHGLDVALAAKKLAYEFAEQFREHVWAIRHQAASQQVHRANEAFQHIRKLKLKDRLRAAQASAYIAGIDAETIDRVRRAWNRAWRHAREEHNRYNTIRAPYCALRLLNQMWRVVDPVAQIVGLKYGATIPVARYGRLQPGAVCIVMDNMVAHITLHRSDRWVVFHPIIRCDNHVHWESLTRDELRELVTSTAGDSRRYSCGQIAGGTIDSMLDMLDRLVLQEPIDRFIAPPHRSDEPPVLTLIYGDR